MRGIHPDGNARRHRPAIGWLRPAAGGLLLIALASCNASIQPSATPTTTPAGSSLLPRAPHVETGTLDELFGLAGPYLQTSGDLGMLTFRCTIVEGTFCWFGDGPQDGPVPSDLARRVVDQVGPKAIENANRNEVAIECSRPVGGGVTFCEIDWGWGAGWEPLPLE